MALMSKASSFQCTRNECLKRNSMFSKVQLWQFLLELLSDDTMSNIIKWDGDYGEFRMNDPQEVAKLWGRRSGRRKMTYQTMSRALRHYYCKGVLSKVKHKKWCYRFSSQALETARNISSIPDTDNVSSNNVESYKALAYERYINTLLLSSMAGVPPEPVLFPSNDFYFQNGMEWPLVKCYVDYCSPGLYSMYSCPVRSF